MTDDHGEAGASGAGDPEFRVLSIDGGGIKGVFPASVLATFEESLGAPLADYFDLIVGTSTGGIIALGLGMGVPATEILGFYETEGPSIFAQPRGPLGRLRAAKYDSTALATALESVFGDRRLGDAATRLMIPSLNLETGEVHVFKTAHHPRFVVDYKERVVDVALATAAAPTYFRTHRLPAGTPLIDGGLWANNPMGPAAVEALGLLGWPAGSVKLLSVGCTQEASGMRDATRWGLGLGGWARHLIDTFMYAQSSASLGTAQLLLGHANVHRVTRVVSGGRYKLDQVEGIESLKGLGATTARTEYPKVESMFFGATRQPFTPLRKVDT